MEFSHTLHSLPTRGRKTRDEEQKENKSLLQQCGTIFRTHWKKKKNRGFLKAAALSPSAYSIRPTNPPEGERRG